MKQFATLVILSLISSTLQNESPLADIAKEIMKEKNMENIGGMVNNFIQSGGAKQIMDGVLQNGGPVLESLGSLLNQKQSDGETNPMDLLSSLGSMMGGAGDNGALLQGLGSLLAGAGNNKNGDGKDGPDTAAILQGLGSIMGAATAGNQAGNGGGTGALLQTLGSMLGGGDKEEGGINPELIGNMINMFASAQSKPSKSPKKKSKKVKKSKEDSGLDLGNILSLASTFMNQKQGSGFLEYMPMIMSTINSFTGPEAEDREREHTSHSWLMPGFLEKIHVYFDHFINSDIGKRVSSYLNKQKAFRVFHDESGNFSYDRFEELIENHSFRKHWIEQLVFKLVNGLQQLVKDSATSEYISTGVVFVNSILQNYGFPEVALLDLNDPTESLTNFANFGAKKYLDAELDARDYVQPVVAYSQNLIKLAKAPVKPGDLANTLTDTINFEIIEPVTRVNRAYRFAKNEPSCDKYVFCMINQKDSTFNPGKLPKLRRALYKGTSLAVGWILSSHTGTSYWDLYEVITQKYNCKKFHLDKCNGFHHEEIKATTEYVHTEL